MELLSTRLPKLNHYKKKDLSGIASITDWFIFGKEILRNKIDSGSPKSIFISSYHIDDNIRFFVNSVLNKLTHPFVLVIGSEDVSFPVGNKDVRYQSNVQMIRKEIHDILQCKIIRHVFVENLDLIHPKLSPLPLGFHPIYDPNILALYKDLQKMTCVDTDRTINVFCNHKIRSGPQWKDRYQVQALCKNAWKEFVTWKNKLSPTEFKNTLMNSKFCICVHGGGIDPSPRAWMALLCGCFPIIQHSTLDEAYKRFPVIFVKDWTMNSISKDKIERWNKLFFDFYKYEANRKKVLQMLTLEYWNKIIMKKNIFGENY